MNIHSLKIEDWITLPTVRPSKWNKKGEMDHFLGKRVQITSIGRWSNGDGIFTFEGSSPWRFQLSDLIQPYIDTIKKWEPEVGDICRTFTPVKVFRNYGDGFLEVCDSDGNCLKVSRKEIYNYNSENNKESSMKAMKDAVLTVAKQLAKANNTVTTLEIKNELRRDYPYYFWTQEIVSNYMSQLAGDGIFSYTDNGTYRIYSLVDTSTPTSTSGSASFPAASKVAGTLPTKTKPAVLGSLNTSIGKKPRSISKSDVFNYVTHSGFESAIIDGNIIARSDIRAQKKSVTGYFSARKLDKTTSVTVNGKTYKVK